MDSIKRTLPPQRAFRLEPCTTPTDLTAGMRVRGHIDAWKIFCRGALFFVPPGALPQLIWVEGGKQ